jgi:methionyl-tRNA formyltransferase
VATQLGLILAERQDVPRIVLFGLTGMGNAVLRALCRSGAPPALVVSRREPGPFPYYAEADIAAEARGAGIEVAFGAEGENRAASLRPDLIMVASYHRILPAAVSDACPTVVNLHPSLLPKYRGPNPFFWVLRNGEASTGVTAHELVAAVDAGEVLWQRALPILPADTQGSLRRRLADLSAEAARATVEHFTAGTLKGKPQDENLATWFGKPTQDDRTIRPSMALGEALNIARAAVPYPGAIVDGQRVCEILETCKNVPSAGLRTGDDTLMIRLSDGAIRFRRAVDGSR